MSKAGIFIVHMKGVLVRISKFLLMLVALLRKSLTACWLILQVFLSPADVFKINFFQRNSFRSTWRMPNNLDPDQDRLCVDPVMGPNCLQSL